MNKLSSLLIFGLSLGIIEQANCADRNSWGTGDLWEDWERASCCEKLQIGIAMCTGSNFFLPDRDDTTPEVSPQGSPTAVTDPIFTRKENGPRPFAKSVHSILGLDDTAKPKINMRAYMNNIVKSYRKKHDEALRRLKGNKAS